VARGGRGAKNKAAVTVARKHAVLMHALWQSGSDYKPQRRKTPPQCKAMQSISSAMPQAQAA
jgi:hypothetical protein